MCSGQLFAILQGFFFYIFKIWFIYKNFYPTKIWQSCGARWWRVCYQRCLPRLVLFVYLQIQINQPTKRTTDWLTNHPNWFKKSQLNSKLPRKSWERVEKVLSNRTYAISPLFHPILFTSGLEIKFYPILTLRYELARKPTAIREVQRVMSVIKCTKRFYMACDHRCLVLVTLSQL